MKVFIVDDEAAARRILRDCAEKEPDLDVAGEFDNADDAIEAIRRAPPDLVFLDIALGARSGIDVARALDTDAPEIVFVTAYDRYAIEAFDVGAIDYLLKPFDETRFRETLAAVPKDEAPAVVLALDDDALVPVAETMLNEGIAIEAVLPSSPRPALAGLLRRAWRIHVATGPTARAALAERAREIVTAEGDVHALA